MRFGSPRGRPGWLWGPFTETHDRSTPRAMTAGSLRRSGPSSEIPQSGSGPVSNLAIVLIRAFVRYDRCDGPDVAVCQLCCGLGTNPPPLEF